MREPASKLANTCQALALIALVLLPLSAFGARWGLFDHLFGLLLFALAALTGIVVILIAGLFTRRQPNPASRARLTSAALLALPPVLFFALNLFAGAGAPAIHDVTTAPDDPPQFTAALELRGEDSNPLNYTEEIARQQREAYPQLMPMRVPLPPQRAFARAERIAEELGWEVHYSNAEEGRIEAVDTTRWFRFKDDVVIRVRAGEPGSVIDLRSVSRVGQGDLGANARRIQRFVDRYRRNLEAEL